MSSGAALKKEVKRLQQKLRREGRAPKLSSMTLLEAVAVWWVSEKCLTTASNFLEHEYQMKHKASVAASGKSTAQPLEPIAQSQLPEAWIDALVKRVAAWTAVDDEIHRRPTTSQTAQILKKAREFYHSRKLRNLVAEQSKKGLTVSTLVLVEKRSLTEEVGAHRPLKRRTKVSNKERMWARRFVKKWGLKRGRFRVGPCLSTEEKVRKVCLKSHRTRSPEITDGLHIFNYW
jgi:hypothetical protein